MFFKSQPFFVSPPPSFPSLRKVYPPPPPDRTRVKIASPCFYIIFFAFSVPRIFHLIFTPAKMREKRVKAGEKWVGFGLYGPLRACTRGKNQVDFFVLAKI